MFEKITGKTEELAIQEELMNPSEDHDVKMNALMGKYLLKKLAVGFAIGATVGIGIGVIANAINTNIEDETEEDEIN